MTKKNIELKTDLDEKIKQSLKSSFNKLKKFEIKPEHNNILFVEIDDTYKRIQYKKMNKKFMCRMMTFNLFNSKTGKYEALNNVQIYFEQDKRLTKYDEKNKLIELTNYIKNTYYDSKMKVCAKGDGAYNIKNLAKNFDYYILDKFHVLKYVKDTFTLKKYIQNKDLKELNAQFYQIKSPTFWKNAINDYSINDWDNLYLKLKKWFDNFEFKTNFKKQFEKFLNYLNNNKRAIFGILDGIERTSHTESYIRNFFKIYLDKRNASYGFETMTELVKNNFNYENGLLQIF
ncbi:Mbov_0401 family ICE element transposase-like protein [Mycoplasmopsis glycophila]|uniref:Transposase n=1 Tax=Mycoplasmopsis glycophila TaxID=171285 RepID=A0A449AVJ6_9BACT|nr:hypothetical protein [Mycoplasmopsis glycophila]VEU70614.1 Uncharacterised protein [Mycoplasmopsis glycophila]